MRHTFHWGIHSDSPGIAASGLCGEENQIDTRMPILI
jgi:hypothetical protein